MVYSPTEGFGIPENVRNNASTFGVMPMERLMQKNRHPICSVRREPRGFPATYAADRGVMPRP